MRPFFYSLALQLPPPEIRPRLGCARLAQVRLPLANLGITALPAHSDILFVSCDALPFRQWKANRTGHPYNQGRRILKVGTKMTIWRGWSVDRSTVTSRPPAEFAFDRNLDRHSE